ncbi:hypothetical protein BV898_06893 [Hypsibius exemplaris]|uniref:Chitin-binding type-2 domain-containing protein n=1 Tax=Hypsibius exemplaris TaxID=2072580 RepID=A0A1W0WV54_HYPEX|nr:hypothetical protein BV898_06893 [Hypsibius exemplaris]
MTSTQKCLVLTVLLFAVIAVDAQLPVFFACNGRFSTIPDPACTYPTTTASPIAVQPQRYYSCKGILYTYPFNQCTYPNG